MHGEVCTALLPFPLSFVVIVYFHVCCLHTAVWCTVNTLDTTSNFLCKVRSCRACVCVCVGVCVCNESGVAVCCEVCHCGGWVITVDTNPAGGLAGGIRRSGGVAHCHLWTVTIWSSSSRGLISVCLDPAAQTGRGNTRGGTTRWHQCSGNGLWGDKIRLLL